MKVFRTRQSLLKWRDSLSNRSVGFVPTMGALHRGHLSLVQQSKKQNQITIVSIFVNPTQFGPNEDFKKYPRTEKEDLRLLKSAKVDAVFLPKSPREVYGKSDETRIVPRRELVEVLEGKFRPGHFEGVATVVFKLFQLAQPTRAYFGEKDFQQLKVIEAMVEDLFLPVKIMPVKTVRERTQLAMSSRNRYLKPDQQKSAAQLYSLLKKNKSLQTARKQIQKAGFQLQYLEKWKGRWMVAAYFHGVRLIDNLAKSRF